MARDDRPHLIELVQRVVDLVVKLIGARIELATTQLQDGARLVGRTATLALVGALVLTVGAVLLSLALVEALQPLVASRAWRLLLVAAPLLLIGAATVQRARSHHRLAGPTADQRNHDADHGQDQEHVDPRAERIAADHAEQPQHQEERGDHPQHRVTS